MKNKVLAFGTSTSETMSAEKNEKIKYKTQISYTSTYSCLNVLKHVLYLKIPQ